VQDLLRAAPEQDAELQQHIEIFLENNGLLLSGTEEHTEPGQETSKRMPVHVRIRDNKRKIKPLNQSLVDLPVKK
jgi:hypothetical protein